jgi:hypothetical protein
MPTRHRHLERRRPVRQKIGPSVQERATEAIAIVPSICPSPSGLWLGPPAQQPGIVLRTRIGPWFVPDGQAAVDMAPMVGSDVARFDADHFHGIDGLQHEIDLRPAINVQQYFAVGTDERERLIGFTRSDGAYDIDA